MELPSTKPYLLRALYEWCCDNSLTPHLVVVVDDRTKVPREHIQDGQIVLNIAPHATNRLNMGNDWIEFQARFGGVARDLSVPVDNVAAIYARENGAGMAFEVGLEVSDTEVGEDGADSVPTATAQKPLTVVSSQGDDDPTPDSPSPSTRPRLQRVK